MGVVYRARHKALKVDHALKMILTDQADLTFVGRFEREARTLAQLNHPHILKVHNYGVLAGTPFLVTALIDGEDFERCLRKNPLGYESEWLVARMIEIASALHYCHEQGIAHRDLKAANVLIREEDQKAILIDFGLVKAKAIDSSSEEALSKTGELLGTPDYMAPEQFDQKGDFGEPGPASDVWAFGVLLYRSLTDQKPFQGQSLFQLCKNILSKEPAPILQLNPEAHPALVALTMKCLQKNSQERPSMAEVKQYLESYDLVELPRQPLSWPVRIVMALLFIMVSSALFYFLLSDRSSPKVTLEVPKKGLYKDSVSIEGELNESGCSVAVNGKALLVEDRKFQFDWPLTLAGQAYEIIVEDRAGNVTRVSGQPKRQLELFVGAGAECDFQTISEALKEAPKGVPIRVKAGRYEEALLIDRPTHIVAEQGAGDVIVATKGQSCVLLRGGETILEGLTLIAEKTAGVEELRAVLIEKGELTLRNCRVRARKGYGISLRGGRARLIAKGSVVDECRIGLFSKRGKAKLEDCSISKNQIYNIECDGGELTLNRCQLNDSKQKMGLILRSKAKVRGTDSIFEGNSGQAIRVTEGASLRMKTCRVLKTKKAPLLKNAKAPFHGTGIYGENGAEIDLEDCQIYGNEKHGLWLQDSGNRLVLRNCEVLQNQGRGITVKEGKQSVTLRECEISRNLRDGFAVDGDSRLQLERVRAEKNGSHGFYVKKGARFEGTDCRAFSNGEGGFVFFIKTEAVLKTCIANGNQRSGFNVQTKSTLVAENCQAKANSHGLFVKESRAAWSGGHFTDQKRSAIYAEKNSAVQLRSVEYKNNKGGKYRRRDTSEIIDD